MKSARYSYQNLMKIEFFLDEFSKNPQILNQIKLLAVTAEGFMRTDGQTDRQRDMTKLFLALLNFSDAPKNVNITNFGKQVKFL